METNTDRFTAPKSGKAFAGLILVIIGSVLLGRQMGLDIPYWVLTWEMLFIGLGLFLGARRGFRPGGWLIMILVGTAFLLDEYTDISIRHFIWPVAIILFGLWMILKPRRQRKDWSFNDTSSITDSHLDINTVFGGTKKKIMSKDFKGGEINSVFGGNDIDLTQADINGSATLDASVVFGGIKLIVPANWKIQSDVDCVFASVEDKRRDTTEVSNKTLILKGSLVFGSIEIKSY
ncbi:MAG: hypothetical protein OJF59_000552 [Cytophagales bacterium]|jgi:predicted membrane protein|nr:hypothetical protein [Bacteroidota bacterium]MBS1981386.1 hypothetical protein [Bacteroidota bacterium]WHZ06799.1 MAG: hypothetical protein OJF59_000552 [Cytophagales bacterium]